MNTAADQARMDEAEALSSLRVVLINLEKSTAKVGRGRAACSAAGGARANAFGKLRLARVQDERRREAYDRTTKTTKVPFGALVVRSYGRKVSIVAIPGSEIAPPWAAAPRIRRGSLDCNGSLLRQTCRTRFVAGRAALDPKLPSQCGQQPAP